MRINNVAGEADSADPPYVSFAREPKRIEHRRSTMPACGCALRVLAQGAGALKEEAALAGKSPLPRGISATPTPLRASRFPRRVTLRRAVVLGALALSQGHRRPRPRSRRPSRAGAAAASGFRGLADRDKRRRAHRARQERACGLGLRQLRPRRADHAGGANLEDARPPRRSHLLVGAIASPALPRDIVCVQRHASAPVDGHRALGYGPAADLRSMVREADAATTRPC
jgi:hypothetical protein